MSRFPLSLCLQSSDSFRRGDQLFAYTHEGRRRYHLRPMAPWLQAELREIYLASDIEEAPDIVLVDSVPDLTAFATPGLIVLGEREITELARRVFREHFQLVDAHTLPTPHRGPLVTFEDIYYGTWRFVVAHEMGHIEQFATGDSGNRLELEMDADHFAGQIAEILGWNPIVDQAVAKAVGCNEQACRWAYQTPHGRSRTYAQGRRFQAGADRHRW